MGECYINLDSIFFHQFSMLFRVRQVELLKVVCAAYVQGSQKLKYAQITADHW